MTKTASSTSSIESTESKVLTGIDAREVDEEKDGPIVRNKSVESEVLKPEPIPRFALASHTFTYDANGHIRTVRVLVEQDDPVAKLIKRSKRQIRQQSQATFTPSYMTNELVRMVQETAIAEKLVPGVGKEVRHMLSGDDAHRTKLLAAVFRICDEVESIFKDEPRVLRVKQPVVVFGDVHGNLADLLAMERMFWKNFASLAPQNFLFLGDYVDRGNYSFEVIVYLFSNKIMAPGKFLLLRGNHEFKSVNKQFSFPQELVRKFGERDGLLLYNRFNTVFQFMPMAAVIEEKIFCAHGGVPSRYGEVCTLATLSRTAVPLTDGDETRTGTANGHPPFWELVWNDPIDKQEFEHIVHMIPGDKSSMQRTGFVKNTKRGTCKYWSELATKQFLAVNKLDFVIRGHEVARDGFMFHHNGLVMTVFSSSNYQGANDAGAVVIQDFKIRPVKLIPAKYNK